jgi:hypothetical protein
LLGGKKLSQRVSSGTEVIKRRTYIFDLSNLAAGLRDLAPKLCEVVAKLVQCVSGVGSCTTSLLAQVGSIPVEYCVRPARSGESS